MTTIMIHHQMNLLETSYSLLEALELIQYQARSKLLFTGTANKMGESNLCMYTDVNGCSCM